MVNLCKGCDVHVFFVEEIRGRVIYSKKVAKNEVDIWIKCLVDSILNKDMIVL